MDKEITEKEIVDILRKLKKPVYIKTILKELNLPKEYQKKVKRLLKKLQRKKIVKYKKAKYFLIDLKEHEEVVQGIVEAHPSGYGFLIVGDEVEDLFIPPP